MSDHSAPASDPSERRQKVVMALGIATIVLFSANLLTVLAHHFWLDGQWRIPFLTEQESAVETASVYAFEVHAPRHNHRIVIRRPDAAPAVIVDGNLQSVEMDLAELERQAQRMQAELERELASIRVEGVELRARQQAADIEAAVESAVESAVQNAGTATYRVRVASPDESRD